MSRRSAQTDSPRQTRTENGRNCYVPSRHAEAAVDVSTGDGAGSNRAVVDHHRYRQAGVVARGGGPTGHTRGRAAEAGVETLLPLHLAPAVVLSAEVGAGNPVEFFPATLTHVGDTGVPFLDGLAAQPPPAEHAPALSTWAALILMVLLLAATVAMLIRRQRAEGGVGIPA